MLPFATVWKLEAIILSEITQTEKDKYHIISLSEESKEQNKQTKQKQTHRYKEQTDSCQRGGVLGVLGEKVEGLRGTNW